MKFWEKELKFTAVIRIICGLAYLCFGLFDISTPENFKNLLRITQVPMVEFLHIFLPIAEILVGCLFIVGRFTRLIALIAAIEYVVLIHIFLHLSEITPADLPDDIKTKPVIFPIYGPIIIGLMALYLLVMGGGPWSLDKYFEKKRKKAAEDESKKHQG